MFRYSLLAVSALAMSACSAEITSDTVSKDSAVATPAANAQSKPSSGPMEKITSTDLGNGLHMLNGPGGNVAVSVGEDGVLVIDDKFARFGGQILDIISSLSDGKIRYVLNTHHHGDHSGGNDVLAKTGAVIVAHDNVRNRLASDKADEPGYWPVLTYSEAATFHFNGQAVKIVHTPKAHTDGDSVIYFEGANLLHMGDNYFNGMFPYVDVKSGGSLQGMIAAQETGLSMINNGTTVMPGHGPIATYADMRESVKILKDIQNRVQAGIDKGQSVDVMIKAGVLSDYKDLVSFIDEAAMIRAAHASLTGK